MANFGTGNPAERLSNPYQTPDLCPITIGKTGEVTANSFERGCAKFFE
jgi:hypothetical protein